MPSVHFSLCENLVLGMGLTCCARVLSAVHARKHDCCWRCCCVVAASLAVPSRSETLAPPLVPRQHGHCSSEYGHTTWHAQLHCRFLGKLLPRRGLCSASGLATKKRCLGMLASSHYSKTALVNTVANQPCREGKHRYVLFVHKYALRAYKASCSPYSRICHQGYIAREHWSGPFLADTGQNG